MTHTPTPWHTEEGTKISKWMSCVRTRHFWSNCSGLIHYIQSLIARTKVDVHPRNSPNETVGTSQSPNQITAATGTNHSFSTQRGKWVTSKTRINFLKLLYGTLFFTQKMDFEKFTKNIKKILNLSFGSHPVKYCVGDLCRFLKIKKTACFVVNLFLRRGLTSSHHDHQWYRRNRIAPSTSSSKRTSTDVFCGAFGYRTCLHQSCCM